MHPPVYVFGRDRQRFAAQALQAAMDDLPLPRRGLILAGFTEGLGWGKGRWPGAFLREFVGTDLWGDGLWLRDHLQAGPLRIRFRQEIRDLPSLWAWPEGADAPGKVFMNHARQKALAWALATGVEAAWPPTERGGLRPNSEGPILALMERFAARLDEANRSPAAVFRDQALRSLPLP